MDGILLIDKPIGWTSFDVVAKVRGALRTETRNRQQETGLVTSSKLPVTLSPKVKVGHTGTLDPLASGLLVLVIGSYTKRAQEFSKMDKTYGVEVTLGFTSVTGDKEGPIEKVNAKRPTVNQIKNAIAFFIGSYEQMPPAYSAKKIDGQRAYKLARAGKPPKIEPRKVSIYDIRNLKINYPKIWFTVDVSSGTYIRSLAVDVGNKLGCGAYMSGLKRTRVGNYKIEQAIEVKDIENKLTDAILTTKIVRT